MGCYLEMLKQWTHAPKATVMLFAPLCVSTVMTQRRPGFLLLLATSDRVTLALWLLLSRNQAALALCRGHRELVITMFSAT